MSESRHHLQSAAADIVSRVVNKDLTRLGLGRIPNIICPKAHAGRLTVFAAFEKYYHGNSQESASRMVQTRYQVLQRYNLCEEDIAHFDLNVCLGLLINTVPASCWTLYYVYSQPSLLKEVRAAIAPHIRVSAEDSKRHVNIANVAAQCPLIASIVHETLRLHSVSMSARKVLEDTLLDGQHLLKQGSTVLIPSAEIHTMSEVWGSGSSKFDTRRFCRNDIFESKKPTSAYRAFGGGSFLCPGRFFAVNEIIIILVTMVLKFDLVPVERTSWLWPGNRRSLATSILAPRDDIRVEMQKRPDLCTFEWSSKG